jgi:hypothetical protein
MLLKARSMDTELTYPIRFISDVFALYYLAAGGKIEVSSRLFHIMDAAVFLP